MTRILATADWHVGSGLDYGRHAGDRLADQEQAIEQMVDLAIANAVDVFAIAGDVWHRRRPTPAELMVVARPLRRLRAEHTCDIVAIAGNHCVEHADSPIALELFEDILDVHRVPGVIAVQGGVTVATLPWTPISRLIAARDGGDRGDSHAIAAQLLLESARDLRARVEGPCVLLLHWSLTEAVTPTGREVGPDFGVAINTAQLAQVGFDAVVAGHIHKAQLLVEGDAPIFYTGSPLPVDFGEAETAHGCYLLELGGPADLWKLDFLPIESRPFVTVDLDEEDLLDIAGDPSARPFMRDNGLFMGHVVSDAVVRVRYRATEELARRIDHRDITQALVDAGAHKVYAIQPDIERAARVRVAGVDEDISPLAALDAWCDAQNIGERGPLAELTIRYLQEAS